MSGTIQKNTKNMNSVSDHAMRFLWHCQVCNANNHVDNRLCSRCDSERLSLESDNSPFVPKFEFLGVGDVSLTDVLNLSRPKVVIACWCLSNIENFSYFLIIFVCFK